MGSALEVPTPPPLNFHDFGDATGNTCYCSLSQPISAPEQTSAHRSWPHPGSAAPGPVGSTPALSQGRQKVPPGEDPALQPALRDWTEPRVLSFPLPHMSSSLARQNIISHCFFPLPPSNQGESPNPSSFLPNTRAPAEQLVPTSRAEPSTTNGLKSPHCTETSLQKQPYFTQTLLNCLGLLLHFLSHH